MHWMYTSRIGMYVLTVYKIHMVAHVAAGGGLCADSSDSLYIDSPANSFVQNSYKVL